MPPPPAVRRALSHPVPVLPDWAFASSRATAGNGAALPLQGAALPSADDVAVPQHIADVRDTSFGTRGSVATVAPASAALVVERKRSLRNHVGLRLIVGAGLVLVTALALAPRQKSPRSAAKARAAAVAGPSSHAQASPPAAHALPATFGVEPSGPFATAPERLVSSR